MKKIKYEILDYLYLADPKVQIFIYKNTIKIIVE